MNYVDYFISFRISNQHVNETCVFVNKIKNNLNNEKFIFYDTSKIKESIDRIKEHSISIKDEQLANSCYVFFQYILFYNSLSK